VEVKSPKHHVGPFDAALVPQPLVQQLGRVYVGRLDAQAFSVGLDEALHASAAQIESNPAGTCPNHLIGKN
jgi:hypothetical protein